MIYEDFLEKCFRIFVGIDSLSDENEENENLRPLQPPNSLGGFGSFFSFMRNKKERSKTIHLY